MFLIFLFCFSIYLAFILFIISGLFKHNTLPVTSLEKLPNISIVIAARNEEINLPDLLQDLIKQEYSIEKLEIIIVDDRSTDSTTSILQTAASNYAFIKNIRIDTPSNKMTPKKYALTKGIEAATGEIIITTDADCRVGKLWASSMAYSVLTNNCITIGYSEIINNNTLFELYQKIDFLSIIVANAGAAGWKKFWSGTGQNLAYYKDDFFAIGGFDSVKHKVSGDDMYLVQSISKIKGGYLHIDPNSFVKTRAVNSIQEFLNQRIRWASNSKDNYQKNPLFFLFLLTSFLFNIIICLSILLQSNWFIMFGMKFILDGFVLVLGGKLFEKEFNPFVYSLWAVLQPIYIPVVAILGINERYSWKK